MSLTKHGLVTLISEGTGLGQQAEDFVGFVESWLAKKLR